jgi:hypothetical protein
VVAVVVVGESLVVVPGGDASWVVARGRSMVGTTSHQHHTSLISHTDSHPGGTHTSSSSLQVDKPLGMHQRQGYATRFSAVTYLPAPAA